MTAHSGSGEGGATPRAIAAAPRHRGPPGPDNTEGTRLVRAGDGNTRNGGKQGRRRHLPEENGADELPDERLRPPPLYRRAQWGKTTGVAHGHVGHKRTAADGGGSSLLRESGAAWGRLSGRGCMEALSVGIGCFGVAVCRSVTWPGLLGERERVQLGWWGAGAAWLSSARRDTTGSGHHDGQQRSSERRRASAAVAQRRLGKEAPDERDQYREGHGDEWAATAHEPTRQT
jgi:hypothetical protein